MSKESISVLIPVYNNLHLLEKNLLSLKLALKNYDSQIIILDNHSTDGTVEYIRKNHPECEHVFLDKNYGFVYPMNLGIEKSKGEYCFFLNSDVQVTPDFLLPLLEVFKTEKDVFSVGSLQLIRFGDKIIKSGASYGYFRKGYLKHRSIFDSQEKEGVFPIFYPGGGAALFDRKKLQKLGGLTSLYAPFYWEDADLGMKAWRRGWKNYINTKSVVYHDHESTARKLNRHYVLMVIDRNKLIFNWLNLFEPGLILKHLIFLPINFVYEIVTGHYFFLFSLLWAIIKLPKILVFKAKEGKERKKNEKEILKLWECYQR